MRGNEENNINRIQRQPAVQTKGREMLYINGNLLCRFFLTPLLNGTAFSIDILSFRFLFIYLFIHFPFYSCRLVKTVSAAPVEPEVSTPPQRPVTEVTRLTTKEIALEDPRSPGSRTPLAVVKKQSVAHRNGGRRAIPFKA